MQELGGDGTAAVAVTLHRTAPMRMQKAVRAPESRAAATVDTPGTPLLVLNRTWAKHATARLAADRMPASVSPAQHTRVLVI